MKKDNRWDELGLNENEIKHVLFLCKKFVNSRDELDDIVQTALVSIYEAIDNYKKNEIIIRNRNSFIGTVVRCKLVQEFIKNNRRDLLYNTIDVDPKDNKNIRLIFENNNDYDNYIKTMNVLIDSNIDEHINKYIAYAYFILDRTQAEIALSIGVHQTRINKRLKSITDDLKKAYLEYNSRG